MGFIMSERPDDEIAKLRKELEEISLRYRALFEETNDAVFLIDLEGFHVKVNERAAKMLGYSVAELLDLSYRDIIHDAELADAQRNLDALKAGEVLPIYERIFKKKDGSLLPVEIDVALIRDNNENPLHFQSIVRDISVRKELERSIKESEVRYRLMTDYVKDVIATIDLNFNLTYVSPAIEPIAGYTVEEATTKNMLDILIPESLVLIQEALQEAFILEEKVGPDGYDAPPIEVGMYHKNGSIIWAEISRVFLRNEDGQPTGVLGVLRDITRRKQAEEALARSERQHRELIENNPEGIGIVDFKETIIFANKAFADMLGYEISELEGMNILDLVNLKDRGLIQSKTVQRPEGVSSTYQIEMITKDGSGCIMRISAVPWRDESGEISGSIAVVTDITERVRAETALEISKKDLELYTELLRHDLRNDLQIILFQIESTEFFGQTDSEKLKVCEAIKLSAKRMLQLIQVFDVPEENLSENLVDLLERKAEFANGTYTGMHVEVHLEGARSSFQINGGRLLDALFDNLFRNTNQYAGPNVRINIILQRIEDFVQVDFLDDGPGIPSQIKKQLFQRGASTSGSGLGLYLSRQIAQAYNGTIDLLETEDGTGFRIRLPAA